ncbi:LON peptidase substrate-binding domain-containing protein [Nocardiopsis sp. N85]|uniref:LON peptidase substrate-binding domain-containing protein n=1 Tax=Nocardiopsis sp. N85 TaxID=3029400 RepID=UPI00237F1FA2|nr:LON peptidase substrate-binding domain-containing protein [Nocardiopsis sp. N85]MDE3720293.1 LON peptidase substrate-binding domain-containing protein [Nocardiopsis sp. N85]
MVQALPIFPLNTVLFPGVNVPLHVFEPRYRRLVAELLGPTLTRGEPAVRDRSPRRFGVVWIELGHEVAGTSSAQSAESTVGAPTLGGDVRLPRVSGVGCTALVRNVRTYDDGRYDLVIEGGTRFSIEDLTEVDASSPDVYPTASVAFLPEAAGPDAEEHAERARTLFEIYRERLSAAGLSTGAFSEMPKEPIPLSYALSETVVLDQSEKQRLLEAEDAATRLAVLARFLRRENRIVHTPTLNTLPAGPFLNNGVSFN